MYKLYNDKVHFPNRLFILKQDINYNLGIPSLFNM
jgi:hypothetical protein